MNHSELHLRDFQTIFSGDVLFTEVIDDAPVRLRHSKPLAVPRTNINIDGAKIVVFLVTYEKA